MEEIEFGECNLLYKGVVPRILFSLEQWLLNLATSQTPRGQGERRRRRSRHHIMQRPKQATVDRVGGARTSPAVFPLQSGNMPLFGQEQI